MAFVEKIRTLRLRWIIVRPRFEPLAAPLRVLPFQIFQKPLSAFVPFVFIKNPHLKETPMQDKYTRFQKMMEDIHDLGKAAGVLSWDRSAYMPPGGAAARARQSATIARVIHEIETSDEMGELLENLDEWKHTLDPDSDEYGLIRLAQREYTRARATPSDLVSRMSEATGLATMAWQKARAEDDFAAFLPHLEKVFALAREYAAHFPHVAHPYDALLDRVEQGLTKAEVERIFNEVKGPQSDLLHRIMDSGVELDDSLLHQSFPREAQLAASLEAAQMLGYDLKRGRLDTIPSRIRLRLRLV